MWGVRSVAVRGAAALRELAARGGERVASLSPLARATRHALGLPGDRVVIMSGHQAEVWHAGILAKWLAGRSIVERLRAMGTDAVFAWVVVDQDVNDPTRIAYPAAGRAGEGPRRAMWMWDGAAGSGRGPTGALTGIPTGCLERGVVVAAPGDGASAGVARGLSRVREALAGAGGATLAEQVSHAMVALLRECGCEAGDESERTKVFQASALTGTEAMAWLAGEMATWEGARACVRAYNDAARALPGAGIAPLATGDARVEVPLWRVRKGAPRERVVVGARGEGVVSSAGGDVVVARALAMTALLRMFACDVFIHGLGGEAYDPVMERWIGAWMGERAGSAAGVSMAPTMSATATVTLRWDGGDAARAASLAEIAEASWRAHAGEHGLLEDREIAGRKRALARAIAALPRRSEERAVAYRAMHAWLEGVRGERGAEIAGLRERAIGLAARRDEARVREERAWAFAMHDPEDLRELRARVEVRIDELLRGDARERAIP